MSREVVGKGACAVKALVRMHQCGLALHIHLRMNPSTRMVKFRSQYCANSPCGQPKHDHRGSIFDGVLDKQKLRYPRQLFILFLNTCTPTHASRSLPLLLTSGATAMTAARRISSPSKLPAAVELRREILPPPSITPTLHLGPSFPPSSSPTLLPVSALFFPSLSFSLLLPPARPCAQPRMLQVRDVQHCQPLSFLRHGHPLVAAVPDAHAELLVGKTLQLELFVGAPFEARVGVEVAASLDECYEGLEDPGEADDEAACGEDQGEEEDGEVGLYSGEDALLVA